MDRWFGWRWRRRWATGGCACRLRPWYSQCRCAADARRNRRWRVDRLGWRRRARRNNRYTERRACGCLLAVCAGKDRRHKKNIAENEGRDQDGKYFFASLYPFATFIHNLCLFLNWWRAAHVVRGPPIAASLV